MCGGGMRDRIGADIASGTRSVLDDELLAEPLRQPLAHQTRNDVAPAAGRPADNDAHRPRRIGFAHATEELAAAATAAVLNCKNWRRRIFMAVPPAWSTPSLNS